MKTLRQHLAAIAKLAQEAQVADGITPEQYEALENLTYAAMDISGTNEECIHTFIRKNA